MSGPSGALNGCWPRSPADKPRTGRGKGRGEALNRPLLDRIGAPSHPFPAHFAWRKRHQNGARDYVRRSGVIGCQKESPR
jgi:hypothetical protein